MERYLTLFNTLSPLGIGLAALVIVVVGSLWYTHYFFGKAWMRHSSMRSTDFTASDMRRGYVFGTLAALLQAVLIALIVDHAGAAWQHFVAGILVIWLFVLFELLNRFTWERASFSLVLIHAFRSLASLMAASFTYHFVS